MSRNRLMENFPRPITDVSDGVFEGSAEIPTVSVANWQHLPFKILFRLSNKRPKGPGNLTTAAAQVFSLPLQGAFR